MSHDDLLGQVALPMAKNVSVSSIMISTICIMIPLKMYL
jgi:hypothetical protein